jgi:hypothetical protein
MLNSNLPETEEWKRQKVKSLKKKGNLNSMLEQIKLSVKMSALDAVKKENLTYIDSKEEKAEQMKMMVQLMAF